MYLHLLCMGERTKDDGCEATTGANAGLQLPQHSFHAWMNKCTNLGRDYLSGARSYRASFSRRDDRRCSHGLFEKQIY